MFDSTPIPTPAASFMDRLFGLTRISWSNEEAELGWRFEAPTWVWVAVVIGTLVLALWSYSRLLGPAWARIVLATVRALLVLFIAMLIAGPMLVVRDELVEPDWLIMLVDRSASMTIRDAQPQPGAPGGVELVGVDRVTRDKALRDALFRYPDLFTDEKLGRDRKILWLGFHAGTYELDQPVDRGSVALKPAEGQSTAIRTAIEQAMQRVAGRPVSGIVLFTDGRSHEATGPDLLRTLKGVSVFPVPLGSAKTPLNLAVARVDAPERAFVDDIVPINVFIDRYPADAAVDPSNVRVRLTDPQTGRTLAESQPTDGLDKPVRLTTQEKAAGSHTWKVEIEYLKPANDPDAPDELLVEDNTALVNIELVDRPLRVLYVEGYPRWEYRYLKQMLIREKSIESSMMLISADRAFAQEGDRPITRLPETIEELDPYDVVIIGDVPSDYFSDTQIRLLRDHIAARGAGLLWIGGNSFTPRTYEATALADLLPMREPAVVEPADAALGPINLLPTPAAGELNILQLRSAEMMETQDLIWPRDLPALRWAQDVGRIKQLTEPLAVATLDEDTALPLVMRLRYGAGQSVYVATDDTFYWRLGKGNTYFEQFWIQLVQMLGKARLKQNQDRVALNISHRRVEQDQAVVVSLVIRDTLLMQRDLPRISVSVFRDEDADDPSARPIDRLELLPAPQQQLDPAGAEAAGRLYETIWRPNTSGRLVLRVTEPALDDMGLTRPVEVVRPDDEMRNPATDHPRLRELASATRGEVVPLDELDKLLSLVRYHTRRTAADNREPLWDSPLALLIVVLLLTAEWIGRKTIRLV